MRGIAFLFDADSLPEEVENSEMVGRFEQHAELCEKVVLLVFEFLVHFAGELDLALDFLDPLVQAEDQRVSVLLEVC